MELHKHPNCPVPRYYLRYTDVEARAALLDVGELDETGTGRVLICSRTLETAAPIAWPSVRLLGST